MVLTVPMPSMANNTVAKNSGMCPRGAINGREEMLGNGDGPVAMWCAAISDVVASAFPVEKRLAPVMTNDIVQPRPTSINPVATAEKGTSNLRVRIIPKGTSGMASPRIHVRME